ncbi:MAG: hypothetical protein KGR26_01085, partial [Cyanobacteria bacterium REEB65]|nr:hypothetical protein [Cyanobacteria bacterium REEB65]
AEGTESWIHRWYWLDREIVQERVGLPGEGHGAGNPNPFNLDYSRILPAMAGLPADSGFLSGTLRTRHLDCRLWPFPNCLAATTGILKSSRSAAFLKGIEERWQNLVGSMPIAVCWPGLAGTDYEVVMDGDTRARPGSYHNGAHWPNILWTLVCACLANGRDDLARRALSTAETGLPEHWGEYYDASGTLGAHARTRQTWTIAGYLVADDALRVGIGEFWQTRLIPPGG